MEATPAAAQAARDDAIDSAPPRSFGELREELHRHLDAFVTAINNHQAAGVMYDLAEACRAIAETMQRLAALEGPPPEPEPQHAGATAEEIRVLVWRAVEGAGAGAEIADAAAARVYQDLGGRA